MQQFAEFKEIMAAEDAWMDSIQEQAVEILDNAFIQDCNIQGIKRYENILGIMPDAAENLEERKKAVLMHLNNKPPYTYRTLLKKLEVLYGSGNYEISGDLGRYTIYAVVHSELRGQKKVLETLLGWFLPMNMAFTAKNEVLRHFIIYTPEEMDTANINLHTQVPFWGYRILNGTGFLDGSVHVDGRRRYGLVLGIGNSIKAGIKETMDTDRIYIKVLSRFNVFENTSSLKAVFKLGCSGFLQTAGSTVQVLAGSIMHMVMAGASETIGDVTVTYRRNLYYVDGSGLLDGSRLVNAFYGKEDI